MEDSRFKTRPSRQVRSTALRSRRSVVAVVVARSRVDKSFGSGFVIHDGPFGSLVLTCSHVVRGAKSVRIRRVVLGGVQELAANVIDSDDTTDIAVLHVPELRRSGTSLALNLTPPRQVNEPAVTIGYFNPTDLLDEIALTRLPATSPGCIRDLDESYVARFGDFLSECKMEPGKRQLSRNSSFVHDLVLLDCVNMKGVSGGPVVDRDGVIGMSFKMGIKGMPRMLAVSSETICGVLKKFAGLPVSATMEEVFYRLVLLGGAGRR